MGELTGNQRPKPGDPVVVTLPQVKQTPGALRFALPGEYRTTVPVSDIYVRKDFVRDRVKGLPIAVEVTVRPIYSTDVPDPNNQGGRA